MVLMGIVMAVMIHSPSNFRGAFKKIFESTIMSWEYQ